MEAADEMKARAIFATEEVRQRFDLTGKRLVHYTSAENAMRILKNGEFWLRNVRAMNDFMEVEHGFGMLARSLRGGDENSPLEHGLQAVGAALDQIFPGMATNAIQEFARRLNAIGQQTYVTCLSDLTEEEHGQGRLSMWRNYSSGQTGVGILVKTEAFQGYTNDLGVFSTPVFYYDDRQLNERLMGTAATIRAESDFLKTRVGQETTAWFFLELLRSLAIGTKHPGFREEREWRVYHTLGIDPIAKLSVETEAVSGVPQRIIKFRLKEYGLSHADLIAGFIVGPSPHQQVIAHSLADILAEKGIPADKLVILFSPIPLRTP